VRIALYTLTPWLLKWQQRWAASTVVVTVIHCCLIFNRMLISSDAVTLCLLASGPQKPVQLVILVSSVPEHVEEEPAIPGSPQKTTIKQRCLCSRVKTALCCLLQKTDRHRWSDSRLKALVSCLQWCMSCVWPVDYASEINHVLKIKMKSRHVLKGGSIAEWLACWMDSGGERSGFKSQSWLCRVTVLGKLLTAIVPLFTKQQNW